MGVNFMLGPVVGLNLRHLSQQVRLSRGVLYLLLMLGMVVCTVTCELYEGIMGVSRPEGSSKNTQQVLQKQKHQAACACTRYCSSCAAAKVIGMLK
jgi:hypothetical protein